MTQVAIIGAGRWGSNLVRDFRALGALGAVCDSNLAAHTSPFPSKKVHFLSVTQLLERTPKTMPVVIATPAETHYEIALAALADGRDVFVEKPIALDVDQAEHLVQVAQRKKVILMVGHVLEYHPAIKKIRGLIAAEILGTIQYVYSQRLNFGRVRREENVMWSFAPHDVAVILRLLGDEEPAYVSAFGARIIPRSSPVEDATVMTMRFAQASAHIFVSWLHPFKEQRLVVVGSKAAVSFDDVGKELTLHLKGLADDMSADNVLRDSGHSEKVEFDLREPLMLECKAFLHAVRTRETPLTDGKSAVRVLRVLERAQESMRHG